MPQKEMPSIVKQAEVRDIAMEFDSFVHELFEVEPPLGNFDFFCQYK